MNRLSAATTGLWLALSVAACGSDPASSSTSESGGTTGSGTGGSAIGGATLGQTGGTTLGGSGGTTLGETGGTTLGETGGTTLSGSGGTTLGGTAGSGGDVTGGGATGGSSGGTTLAGSGGDVTGGGGGATGGGTALGGTGGEATGGGAAGGGSGGEATAGAATGGGSTVLELVISGPNDYWNTATQATEVTSGAANLTVDENTTFQTWDGFGGTFNEMGWDALSVVSSEMTRALTLLFGEDGANFVYGRIPIGASDYSMSWYTLAETANDYAMDDFSIDRDREMLIPYIEAALEIEPNLRLWGSPWVVPGWMMNGRAMRSDAQTLEAHALYFAKFVEEYATEGITIEAVHLQNEPGYARVAWDDTVFVNFFKTYLGPTFVERGLNAEIWCGTMSHPDDANLAIAVANDPESMQYVTGFGLQWNHEATVASLAPFGPVMQTEHRCGNYSFTAQYWDQSRYDPNTPQNDHLYGEESWQLIRDWMVGGVNSYLAWNMILDSEGHSLDGWPQNALLVVDRSTQQLIVTPAYYVFRHYSQYITPGATRIGITGSQDAVAFRNPDGSIITEVYNSDESSRTMTVDVRSTLYQFDVPAHGWATFRVGS